MKNSAVHCFREVCPSEVCGLPRLSFVRSELQTCQATEQGRRNAQPTAARIVRIRNGT